MDPVSQYAIAKGAAACATKAGSAAKACIAKYSSTAKAVSTKSASATKAASTKSASSKASMTASRSDCGNTCGAISEAAAP